MAMTCYEYAIYYLSRYPKSEKEMQTQLLQKGYYSDDVKTVIDLLKKRDYLNDEAFTKAYLNSEVVNKGKPLFLITGKLLQKGIDKAIITKVCHNLQEDMQTGVEQKIRDEIKGYKKKGLEGLDIIQKIYKKGYKIADIKSVIEKNKKT